MTGYHVVVTRYGGRRHLAPFRRLDTPLVRRSRHFTACMGTSSWTIEEWERVNADPAWEGHPQGLTGEVMRALTPCPDCIKVARIDLSMPEIEALLGVTPRHTKEES